jgi:hypothetical protein
MKRGAGTLLLGLAVSVAGRGDVGAQRPEPLTERSLRALTRQAEAEGGNDRSAVVLALDKRFRARWGSFESFPVSIVRREDLTIFLTTPYMAYRRAVAEHLRMREPLRNVPWVDAAVVTISPDRQNAPDIVRVDVARDGAAVAPLKSSLKPMTFTNGLGESAVLHAGEVHFPMSAFAPGAPVTVTAVPREGAPIALRLDDDRLRELK